MPLPRCYYIYMVKCRDGTFYTGKTTDIEKRIRQHNGELPRGAKYTKPRRPVQLVYSEQFPSSSDALKREHAIKQLTKKQKEQLISRGCLTNGISL